MDEDYDVIILGTGLKECILSGLLSVSGKKVLHLDENEYYGAESASLNLKQLYKKFEGSEEKIDEDKLGSSKQYSIDLCPKFLMGCGNLVKMLLYTKVTRYLEFRSIDGSFVFKDKKLYPVPMTPSAALSSSLMGIFQKRRYKNFLQYVLDVKRDNKKTWGKQDLTKVNMKQVFEYWKCDENTQAFTGHAVALYTDDSYLSDPKETLRCIERLQLYAWSLSRFEKSPYIYPIWGLGGLPEGFSRLAAVHGGVYMLRRKIEKIEYNTGPVGKKKENDKETNEKQTNEKQEKNLISVTVSTEGKTEGTATCKQLISSPYYFAKSKKVKKTGQVARWLCILDHPLDNTSNSPSAQIILPTKQTGHKADIYISVMSSALQVAPKGKYIAMISSQVYTSNPKRELKKAYDLLGKVLKEFFFVTDQYEPCNQNEKDNVFITSSMDATTHFERATKEVMAIYKQITGQDVDLTKNPEDVGTDKQYE